MFDSDRDRSQKFFTAQATARGLSAALMIRGDGTTVERADVKMDKAIVLPSKELLAKITETEPQIALIPEGDHVAAAVKLHGYDDMYLYAARLLDPRVVEQLRATQENVGEYATLEARRLGIQIAFALMFAVIALIG
jgi:two-component system nitrogen regulation sensor histidine kinase NtrY